MLSAVAFLLASASPAIAADTQICVQRVRGGEFILPIVVDVDGVEVARTYLNKAWCLPVDAGPHEVSPWYADFANLAVRGARSTLQVEVAAGSTTWIRTEFKGTKLAVGEVSKDEFLAEGFKPANDGDVEKRVDDPPFLAVPMEAADKATRKEHKAAVKAAGRALPLHKRGALMCRRKSLKGEDAPPACVE